MKRTLVSIAICSLAFTLNGCGGGGDAKVSVVDLDKVLDIVEKVMNEKAPGGATPANTQPVNANTNKPGQANAGQPKPANADGLKPIDKSQENAQLTATFLKRLTVELNKAKLVEDHIGVQMLSSGAIEGFIDENKDGKKLGPNEKKLFLVEIDHAKSRLIATDDTGQSGETYRRDRRYHYRPGGFFMGYMLGSMMGRQNSFYSGGRTRPNYGSMKMNNRGYHTNAVAKARTRAKASGRSYNGRSTGRTSTRGARSGGSRSFRGGK